MNKTTAMSSFYFYVFFSFGGLFSLLGLYLKNEVHLTGTQIGTIMSIGPIVMMLSQPIWGMISDFTGKPRNVLISTVFLTGISGLGYLVDNSFVWIFIIATILAFFQSAIIPISDSLVTSYVYKNGKSYGSIRAWGSIGYSLSVLIVGKISELFGSIYIFLSFAVALIIASLFAKNIPQSKEGFVQANLKSGLKELFKLPQYVLFLFITFFVFGPILANNFYFSIFFESVGGTVAGLGIAFLLMAGSEVPFMQMADWSINRFSMKTTLIFAVVVSMLRWLLYFTEPSELIVLITSVLQGLSIGLFIPAALQYVKNISPKKVEVTAVSLYSAAGNGLGCWFCTILGGMFIDYFSVFYMYLFFTFFTLLGLICLLFLPRINSEVDLEK